MPFVFSNWQLDELFSFVSSVELGKVQLKMRLVFNVDCMGSPLCQTLLLTVLYTETNAKSVIELNWVIENRYDFEIIIPQLPLKGWLLVIYKPPTSLSQTNCSNDSNCVTALQIQTDSAPSFPESASLTPQTQLVF